ncbi:B3 domain-containing protein Os03g0620500-like [Panicum virgatum]|nr:B3 domain-containing protein Os03g0620500-like [Panicum virgatum]
MSEEIVGENGTFSLDFGSRYAAPAPHLPDGKQTLTLSRDGWRKAWRIKMLNRRMLPGELREFACDNRLRTGDLCLFEPTTKERLAMSVRIIRSEQYS